jgi:hypothetical protein
MATTDTGLMTGGLVVFVLCWALCGLGLGLDLGLDYYGFRTFTSRVWQSPLLGLPILSVPVAGLLGLAYHFYGVS